VTDEKNRLLVEVFTEEELRQAMFQMEHNKSPGPDGFWLNFIKHSGRLLR
jgi:hypothetical protein